MPKSRPQASRAGFSVAEGLIALLILGLIGLAATQYFGLIGKGTQRTRLLGTMIAVDSTVRAALLDSTNFTAYQSSLAAGSLPPNFQLLYAGDLVATIGTTAYGLDGAICSPSALAPCPVLLDFNLQNRGASGATNWHVLYRVRVNPAFKIEGPAVPSLGAAPEAVLSDPSADSQAQIPKDFYAPPASNLCEGERVLMRGYNVSSNVVSCWQMGTQTCGDNQLPVGLAAFDVAGQNDGLLQVKCVDATVLKCPPLYALTTAGDDGKGGPDGRVFRDLVPGGGLGTCVFMGKDTTAPQKPNGIDWTCPENYVFRAADNLCHRVPAKTVSALKGP